MDLVPTPSQTAGPYFHLGMTNTRSVACIAGPEAKGERIWITLRIVDGEGTPLDDAMIEIWQASAEGKYAHPEDKQEKTVDSGFRGFGRLATAQDGTCVFETIKPGRVAGPEGTLQAPHLNVSVLARGVLRRLATRVYFAGDSANDEDPILRLVPAERRNTLLAQPDPTRARGWRLDIHLQGDEETVFFDV
jgi:protocatechuate 3,4-dioxygenase alpha subunit